MHKKQPQPYMDIPYLPLENQSQDSRNGAQFFSNVKSLQVGFGSKVFRVDRSGMWAGAETFTAAPWRVDWNGNMTATSITISGYIPTGGALADIGSGNITETYIGNNAISSGKIAANAVIAGKVAANAITATEINVTNLASINANIGAITAGSLTAVSITGSTITGGTLQTATTGKRIVISGSTNDISIYNSTSYVGGIYGSVSAVTGAGNSIVVEAPVFEYSDGITTYCSFVGGIAYFNLDMVPANDGVDNLGSSSLSWGQLWTKAIKYIGVNQPVVYWGIVSGTFLSPSNTTFSVSNPSTGHYTITHNLGNTNYGFVVSAIAASGAGAYIAKVDVLTTTAAQVIIFDTAGAAVASNFSFILTRGT